MHALMKASGTPHAVVRHPGSNAHSAQGSCCDLQLSGLAFSELGSVGGQCRSPAPPAAPAELLPLHLDTLAQGTFPSTDEAQIPDVFTWAPATGSSQAHSAGSAGWPPSPRHHSPAVQGVTVSLRSLLPCNQLEELHHHPLGPGYHRAGTQGCSSSNMQGSAVH